LLPVYGALLDRLKRQGVAWVQIDEPILGLDLPHAWRSAFENTYWQLNQVGVPLLLATYFSPLEENLSLACRLPVAGLHVDGVRAPHELTSITDWLPVHKVLSVGIVDGRNIWRTDLDAALAVLQPLAARRAASCGWRRRARCCTCRSRWPPKPRSTGKSGAGWPLPRKNWTNFPAEARARRPA
jgi:5-methyltetrahydropteroyltriglutamate--homocysteine methyltransferase